MSYEDWAHQTMTESGATVFVAQNGDRYGYSFGVSLKDAQDGKHPVITEWYPLDSKVTLSQIARKLLRTAIPLHTVGDVTLTCPNCHHDISVQIRPLTS